MYRPNRTDVAKLVSSANAQTAPELMSLFHYLVARIPELRDLWEGLDRRVNGEVPLADVVLLYFCLTEEIESARAYGAAVWMVRQVPETRRFWEELEAMAEEAGLPLQFGRFPTEILATRAELELLLANEWERPEEIVDPCGEGFNYEWMVKTLGTRIARGEGDRTRLEEVRKKLVRDAIVHADRRDWLFRRSREIWLRRGFDLLFGAVWAALLLLVLLVENAGWFTGRLGWLMVLSGLAALLVEGRLFKNGKG